MPPISTLAWWQPGQGRPRISAHMWLYQPSKYVHRSMDCGQGLRCSSKSERNCALQSPAVYTECCTASLRHSTTKAMSGHSPISSSNSREPVYRVQCTVSQGHAIVLPCSLTHNTSSAATEQNTTSLPEHTSTRLKTAITHVTYPHRASVVMATIAEQYTS